MDLSAFKTIMAEPREGFKRLEADMGKLLANDPSVNTKLTSADVPGMFHLEVRTLEYGGVVVKRYYADRWLWTMVDSWIRVYSKTMELPEFLDLQM